MAEETSGQHITPFDQDCLLVEKTEMVSDIVTRVKARSQTYSVDVGGGGFAPRMSLHYYCEPQLAPRPGMYVRLYLEEIGRDVETTEE